MFFVWVTQMAADKDYHFLALPPILPVIVFLGLALVSFVAGLTHSALTANVVRHFGEIILSMLLFVLVTNVVRTRAQLKFVVGVLIVAGFLTALVGVVLYVLPRRFRSGSSWPCGWCATRTMCCATSRTTPTCSSGPHPSR